MKWKERKEKRKKQNEKIWNINKNENNYTTELQNKNTLGLVSKNMTKWLRELILRFQ